MIRLIRNPSTEQGTFGVLILEDGTKYQTAELPWRDNERKVSCIPDGTYKVALVNSPRFGRVYGLADVPGRSHILIHAGNFAGNVERGWVSDVEGCILLGTTRGLLKNVKGNAQQAVTSSKPALADFMHRMAGAPFDLTVSWANGR